MSVPENSDKIAAKQAFNEALKFLETANPDNVQNAIAAIQRGNEHLKNYMKTQGMLTGGQYNMPAITNVDGLVHAGNEPVASATVHVGTLTNTPAPFSAGLVTDFNDATRTVPPAIVQSILPNHGSKVGGGKPKSKKRSTKRT